jgi:hypothetical protein
MALPTIRVPVETHEALKLLAGKNRRSINSEANIALDLYIEQNRDIIEALRQEEAQ